MTKPDLHEQRGRYSESQVLVAEDNPVNVELAMRMVSWFGCRVSVASNGLEAFEMWKNGSFDLIFMDWQMPVMDGIESTSKIRTQEEASGRNHIPIIALTGQAMEGDQEECLAAGMNDYISKPFSLDDFAEKLQVWLQTPPEDLDW